LSGVVISCRSIVVDMTEKYQEERGTQFFIAQRPRSPAPDRWHDRCSEE
jgi:hypothetical protein